MAELPSSPLAGLDPACPTESDIEAFLQLAHRPSAATWAARRLMRPFFSDFGLNGMLGTYPLFLLATSHWRALLGDRAGGRLLDIGAAAGDVTREVAPLFDEVVATDTSGPMVRRLRRRGFSAQKIDLAQRDLRGGPFDTVALLNVLDRCEHPDALLRSALRMCRPGGTVIVSMPLPYDPWRYAGSLPMRPKHPLPLRGQFFEADLGALVDVILPTAGIEPLRWVRTPYVSAGDLRKPEYRLPAAVIIGRRVT